MFTNLWNIVKKKTLRLTLLNKTKKISPSWYIKQNNSEIHITSEWTYDSMPKQFSVPEIVAEINSCLGNLTTNFISDWFWTIKSMRSGRIYFRVF